MVAARTAHATDCHSDNVLTGYSCWSVKTNEIMPSQTYDGSASDPSGHVDENYVYAPTPGNPNLLPGKKLLLFLPGNNGPVSVHRDYYATAAKAGYYVIALAYRNQIHTPDMCGYWPLCYGYFYGQQVDGWDTGFYSHDARSGYVPAYNSITYRFGSVLAWLINNHGGAGVDWNVFWDYGAAYAPGPGYWYNGAPAWNHIVISGHSQGGEVATWIVGNKPVIAGIVFSAPYATLNNNHKSEWDGDTTPNGPPHHMVEESTGWQDRTSWFTGWATSGGTPHDDQYADYLAPTNWSADKRSRLFVTADVNDGIYTGADGITPGHDISGATTRIGLAAATLVSSCPAGPAKHFYASQWDPTKGTATGCDGHHAMINDGCTPTWIKCYWNLLLAAASQL